MGNERLRGFVEGELFNGFIMALIVVNTLIVGLLTLDLPTATLDRLVFLDSLILLVFLIEISLKIVALGSDFVDDKWNIFDLFIVTLSTVTTFSSFSVLRAFRVMKVLRLLRVFPELRKMIESTSRSLRSILAISTLLGIVIYVFAVMSVMLFGDLEGVGEKYFGNLGLATFSLFQVMTLDSWAEGMVRQLVVEEGLWVAFYFGFYILATTFTFLNMFIAVFTNAMASVDIEDGDNVGFSRIINELKHEISDLKASLTIHSFVVEEEE
jgi:voltage-gated sodium channel